MTPRDFCLWLQGYLAHEGDSVLKDVVLKRMEEVDMREPKPADPPWSLPIQPTVPNPWPVVYGQDTKNG